MTSESTRLALVKEFDDLCTQINNELLINGSEEEYITFVKNHLNYAKKWKLFETEMDKLNKKNSSLEYEKSRLEVKLAQLRKLCIDEINRRKIAEKENKLMKKQIDVIKEVIWADTNMNNETREKISQLKTCAQISPLRLGTIDESFESLLSASEIDHTEGSVDTDGIPCVNYASNKKQTSLKKKLSFRRKKLKEKNVTFHPSENKIMSSTVDQNIHEIIHASSQMTGQVDESEIDQLRKHTPRNLSEGNWNNLESPNSCNRKSSHSFVTQTRLLRSSKCSSCGRTIRLCKQALKCEDCKVVCHPECKGQCFTPCESSSNTLIKKLNGNTISDYTASASPMIPSPIFHCVTEIEKRGLKDNGLYCIPGEDREVKILIEKFSRGNSNPCLDRVNVHVLCSTIKKFLSSLEEPLIPHSFWKAFSDSSDIIDYSVSLAALYDYAMDLPQPNQDTLAFLILHWQRVADSQECKMPVEKLADILGPTVIGHYANNFTDTLSETNYHSKIMHRLLCIPCDLWLSMLNIEHDAYVTSNIKFSEISEDKKGRLGPFYLPGDIPENESLSTSTPRVSRNSKFCRSGKSFFSSPLLK